MHGENLAWPLNNSVVSDVLYTVYTLLFATANKKLPFFDRKYIRKGRENQGQPLTRSLSIGASTRQSTPAVMWMGEFVA